MNHFYLKKMIKLLRFWLIFGICLSDLIYSFTPISHLVWQSMLLVILLVLGISSRTASFPVSFSRLLLVVLGISSVLLSFLYSQKITWNSAFTAGNILIWSANLLLLSSLGKTINLLGSGRAEQSLYFILSSYWSLKLVYLFYPNLYCFYLPCVNGGERISGLYHEPVTQAISLFVLTYLVLQENCWKSNARTALLIGLFGVTILDSRSMLGLVLLIFLCSWLLVRTNFFNGLRIVILIFGSSVPLILTFPEAFDRAVGLFRLQDSSFLVRMTFADAALKIWIENGSVLFGAGLQSFREYWPYYNIFPKTQFYEEVLNPSSLLLVWFMELGLVGGLVFGANYFWGASLFGLKFFVLLLIALFSGFLYLPALLIFFGFWSGPRFKKSVFIDALC